MFTVVALKPVKIMHIFSNKNVNNIFHFYELDMRHQMVGTDWQRGKTGHDSGCGHQQRDQEVSSKVWTADRSHDDNDKQFS